MSYWGSEAETCGCGSEWEAFTHADHPHANALDIHDIIKHVKRCREHRLFSNEDSFPRIKFIGSPADGPLRPSPVDLKVGGRAENTRVRWM